MPYIKKENRKKYDDIVLRIIRDVGLTFVSPKPDLQELLDKVYEELTLYFLKHSESRGNINYAFTKATLSCLPKKYSYKNLDIVCDCLDGAANRLHCRDIKSPIKRCKEEFSRRIIAPYEDKKIKENGDVYYEIF